MRHLHPVPDPVTELNGLPVREYDVTIEAPGIEESTIRVVALDVESAGDIAQDMASQDLGLPRDSVTVITVTDVGPGQL